MFKPSNEIQIKATFDLSPNVNFKQEKKLIAVNGEGVVSRQELEIYEYLLGFEQLHIVYEKPYMGSEKTLYPDFTIENKLTGKTFVWEHLGMTNNERYLDKIPEKILWYRKNGLESIENGGSLILSFYKEGRFYKDVVKFVALILSE